MTYFAMTLGVSRMLGPMGALTITAAVALCSVGAAQAQGRREQSRAHFERGVALISESRFEDAVTELEAARSLYATASIHFNLGLAYREVGRLVECIESFDRYLAAAGSAVTPERRAEVDRYVRAARAATVRLRLDVVPTEATISIDGVPLVRGTSEVAVNPGSHVVLIAARGYQEDRREIVVEAGTSTVLRASLSRTSTTLVVDVDPETATLSLDGAVRGVGDQELDVSPGRHILGAELDGQRVTRELTLEAGQRLEVALSVGGAGGEDLTALWVVLAVLLIGGAGGAVAAAVVLNPSDEPPLSPNLGVVTTALGVSW